MIRILHVAQPTEGGVARYLIDSVRHQVSSGFDVHVACPVSDQLADPLADLGTTLRPWAARRAVGPWVAEEVVRLAALMRSVRPDLVHLHSAKAGLAGRLAIRGAVPTVYQPHGWSFDAASGLQRTLAISWERAALRWTAMVLCVSEGEKKNGLSQGLPLDSLCTVVANGVDLAEFYPQDKALARNRLGLSDAPLAVCVGRLSQQKGQGVLLDAWPLVRERIPNAQLALVGDGPCRSELEAAAAPDIHFMGAVSDPRSWYAAADLVVLPSRSPEGMPLVVLEAMASRRSVVVTDVAGVRDALPPGSTGIVPAENPGLLAAAVAERLASPLLADDEGLRNRRHAQQDHDVEVTAARVMAVYKALLSGRVVQAQSG
jgi:glycosyltransferase involved in cell wall biosynthesis